jgi:tetratricopeptide (TPR) repeat protein
MRRVPVSWFSVLALVLFASASARAEPAPLRTASDLKELARMGALHPQALALFNEGDALLARGDALEAAHRFQKASELAPEIALLLRRQGQALTWAGYRGDALEACRKSISLASTGAAPALRAAVGAFMSTTPTSEELAVALNYARLAAEKSGTQPWAYAARCDIALRLGEPTMLKTCKQQLLTLAPGHYETDRVAGSNLAQTSLAVFAAWGAAALLALYTLAHAILRAFSPRRGRDRSALSASGAALALVVSVVSLPARADIASEKVAPSGGLGKWKVNLQDPISSVPTPAERDGNPIEFGYHVMDLGDLTGQAEQRGDHALAAKLSEAMVKAVPDAAGGYRRACHFNELAGNRERALMFCRGALAVEGVIVDDYLRYTQLVFALSTTFKKPQIDDFTAIIQHLKSEAKAEGPAAIVQCQLATRIEDRRGLEACTQVLAKLAPNDPKTISFQWTLAMLRGDMSQAQKLFAAAKEKSLNPEAVETMQKAMQAELSVPRRLQRNWHVLLAGAGGLMVVGLSLSLRRRGKGPAIGLQAS